MYVHLIMHSTHMRFQSCTYVHVQSCVVLSTPISLTHVRMYIHAYTYIHVGEKLEECREFKPNDVINAGTYM